MKRMYGGNDTIHGTKHLDVEVDSNGIVVAVWFRCMLLPFKETKVEASRANAMRESPASIELLAVEIDDK